MKDRYVLKFEVEIEPHHETVEARDVKGLSEKEREAYFDEICWEWAKNNVRGYWTEVE